MSNSSSTTSAITTAKKKTKIDRSLTGSQPIFSDVFKLSIAKYARWDGIDKKLEKRGESGYIQMEHTHMFRTFESNGRKTETCSLMGGHLHEVSVEMDAEGNPITEEQNGKQVYKLKVGPPKVIKSRNLDGKKRVFFEKIPLFINGKSETVYDEHTHKTQYLKSDKVQSPTMTAEAAKVIGELQAAFNPPLPEGASVASTRE